jgi:hypothetical protein
MISIFALFPLLSQSNDPYTALWSEVNRLIEQNLPTSALEKVKIIMEKAARENNKSHLFKGHIMKCIISQSEYGVKESIQYFETLLKGPHPEDKLAASYLAQIYQQYFENNRYDISQRTIQKNANPQESLEFWDSQKFISRISDLYAYSISEPNLNYEHTSNLIPILENPDCKFSFRPTLYEMLVDKAISFFTLDIASLPSSDNDYKLSSDLLLSNADQFLTYNVDPSSLASSNEAHMILALQQVIRRQKSQDMDALAHFDLLRIIYVYQNGVIQDKDEKYLNSLLEGSNRYAASPYAGEYLLKIAEYHHNISTDSSHLVQAVSWAEKVINKYPNTPAAAYAQNLIHEIKKPFVDIMVEQVYPQNHNMLIGINHKNIQNITIKVVSLQAGKNRWNSINQDEVKTIILDSPAIYTQNVSLNLSPFFKNLKTELSLKGLDQGHYAIVITDNSDFFQYSLFSVSDLAYTTYQMQNQRHFYVVDRLSGKPIKGANIEIHTINYQDWNKPPVLQKIKTIKTDRNGHVTTEANPNQTLHPIIRVGKKYIDFEYYYSDGFFEINKDETRFAEIYTDRAIYRPGQVIHFKAIAAKSYPYAIPNILTNEKINVTLADANGQKISELALVTNKWGSASGQFTIPSNGLTGSFIIYVANENGTYGNKEIRVEEYKRPTFQVKEDLISTAYKLGDKVTVTGTAKTYAGVNVANAKVQYTIKRGTKYPYWFEYGRFPYEEQATILAIGNTVTDANGNYEISFLANDNPKYSNLNKILTFTIEVQVTDDRGESQSTLHTINVAAFAFQITSNVPKESDLSLLRPIIITATNLNNQAIDASANLKIVKLKEPEVVYISRYWDEEINHPLPVDEYRKNHTHYSHPTKTTFVSWPEEKVILETKTTTKDSIPWPSTILPGVYKIICDTRDKNDIEVKSIQYVIIKDFKNGKFPKSQFVFDKLSKDEVLEGDIIDFQLGVSSSPIYVHVVATYLNNLIFDKIVHVKSLTSLKIPVGNRSNGQIQISYTYFIANRMYSESKSVQIKDPKRNLHIQYNTYRDKTVPGSNEKYSLKVTDDSGVGQLSEVLVTMYDASLDAYANAYWRTQFEPYFYSWLNFENIGFGSNYGMYHDYSNSNFVETQSYILPSLLKLTPNPIYVSRSNYSRGDMLKSSPPPPGVMSKASGVETTNDESNVMQASDSSPSAPKSSEIPSPKVIPPLRSNFKETVFFYPHLETDASGNLTYSFTINDAITTWKLMTLAHNHEMTTAYDVSTVVTQKDIMVIPSVPRFMREGDKVLIATRVENTSSLPLEATVSIAITDIASQQDISHKLISQPLKQNIMIPANSSSMVDWSVIIPEGTFNTLKYKIIADAGNHQDGEENLLPILTNRVPITESMPMWVRGEQTKVFYFKNLTNTASTDRKDISYNVEFTAHPIWFAIQAMPYISSLPSITTDGIIERLYTNQLAAYISKQNPTIQRVFENWKANDSEAITSQLEKNPQLRNIIIEETPWVMEAKSESSQRHNIALLFDANLIQNEKLEILRLLSDRQLEDGGFPWFKGDRSNLYTTLHVVELLGKLESLGVSVRKDDETQNILSKSQSYLDKQLQERYRKLLEDIKKYGGKIEDNHLDDLIILQLYVMSLFEDWNKLSPNIADAYSYYVGQAKKYWNKFGLTTQAMIGITLFKSNDDVTSKAIIQSFRERKTVNPELGTYWNIGNGYHWQEIPISRQSTMIEFFSTIDYNIDEIDDMKIWLLKQKQTNHWKSGKATVDAIHALLLQKEKGSKLVALENAGLPDVLVGGQNLYHQNNVPQAGTGYIFKAFTPPFNQNLGSIEVNNPNKNIAWGAAYYQYLENIDEVKQFNSTPLKLLKSYYKVENTAKGERLVEISDNNLIQGDKIRVKIKLSVDRSMNYIHMKDLRPSGFEPTNVISQFKYQDGLSYYESTKDVASHFFFTHLPKGDYVFEYDMSVVHKGKYTSGMTTIESMYAPEFRSHSNSVKIIVK